MPPDEAMQHEWIQEYLNKADMKIQPHRKPTDQPDSNYDLYEASRTRKGNMNCIHWGRIYSQCNLENVCEKCRYTR